MNEEKTPGQVFREELHRRWTAQGRRIDTRPYDQLPEGDREDLEAAVLAAVAHVAGEMKPAEPLRFALVEQMGHRSTVASVREVTFCGKQMIEATDLKGGGKSLIAPDSIYEITWLTEAQAHARTAPWTAVALLAANPNPWGDEDDFDADDRADADEERDIQRLEPTPDGDDYAEASR